MPEITIENVIENSNRLTILTAKKTVNSLYDYLHIKGLYLSAKIRPEDNTLLKEENIAFIVDFLDKTNLNSYPFWFKLDREVKMVASRYITLRDESDMTLISSSRKRDASIFVLLSGRGTVATVSNESPRRSTEKLKHGSVIGPIELFNSEKEASDVNVTFKCSVSSGSVLQLKYQDIYRAKYGDQSLTTDPNEGLTQEEVSLRSVASFGEKRLSVAMVQFLRKNNLLPTTEKDNSYKYIKYGNIGRGMSGKRIENELLIILDGSLRITIGCNNQTTITGGDSSFGDIKCSRSGEKSATFKIQQIPLSLVENGAILHLDEKILSSGTGAEVSSNGVLGGEIELMEDSVSLGGMEPVISASSSSPIDLLQHIRLVFDKPTTYLAIPLKKFKNALQNETHRVNIDIRQEVNEIAHGLSRRLETIVPLLAGGYAFNGGKAQFEESVQEVKGDVLCNGDIASAESSLAGAYGIFSKLECKLE